MSRTEAFAPQFRKTKRKKRRTSKPNGQDAASLLPPENEIEIAPPGSSGETLNQRRLREFYALQTAYVDLRARYFAAYGKVQDLILAGADIQQGSYKVTYGVRLVRRPRYKQVVIDLKGEQFQKEVLNKTAPHGHFRVRVE